MMAEEAPSTWRGRETSALNALEPHNTVPILPITPNTNQNTHLKTQNPTKFSSI